MMKVNQYHKPIVLKVDFRPGCKPLTCRTFHEYDFASCDFSVINAKILASDCDQLLSPFNVDVAVSAFEQNIHYIIHDTVPVKIRRSAMRLPQPW